MSNNINVSMKVEGNQVIFTVEGGDPETVGVLAEFLARGMDALEHMAAGDSYVVGD